MTFGYNRNSTKARILFPSRIHMSKRHLFEQHRNRTYFPTRKCHDSCLSPTGWTHKHRQCSTWKHYVCYSSM